MRYTLPMTQEDAFRVLTLGKNVFLTGAAGSGKTYVLNRYIAWLREHGIDPAVTASTGIAATHLGGMTIHSWSGIGVRESLTAYDIDALTQNERLVKRFRNTSVLILDEVSMLSAQVLAMVDASLRAGRGRPEPFGGIQVVLCGDFFQLPPVGRGAVRPLFAWQSASWDELDLQVCYLEESHRQDDAELLALLNGIRAGHVPSEARVALEARIGLLADERIPRLYTHNADVDVLNAERLAKLDGPTKRYDMMTSGPAKLVEALVRGLLVPETLYLKVGATVMFVKNDPQEAYVNGTLGVVTGFTDSAPTVRTHDGRIISAEPASWRVMEGDKVRAEVTQVPLRLAWAVTVHKSQGLSLDAAHIDLTRCFVEGQGYVALSRVRRMDGIYLAGLSPAAYDRHAEVALADERFRAQSEKTVARLRSTPRARLSELQAAFMERSGGSARRRKGPKKKGAAKKPHNKGSTLDATLALIRDREPLPAIADMRGLAQSTIRKHIEDLHAAGKLTTGDITHLLRSEGLSAQDEKTIARAFKKSGDRKLAPVYEALEGAYSYDVLALARLRLGL